MENSWQFLTYTLNLHLSYDPEIPFLGIYPREINIHVSKKSYIDTSITALFIVAKNWKRSNKCPSSDEWINKVLVFHTEDYDPGAI